MHRQKTTESGIEQVIADKSHAEKPTLNSTSYQGILGNDAMETRCSRNFKAAKDIICTHSYRHKLREAFHGALIYSKVYQYGYPKYFFRPNMNYEFKKSILSFSDDIILFWQNIWTGKLSNVIVVVDEFYWIQIKVAFETVGWNHKIV